MWRKSKRRSQSAVQNQPRVPPAAGLSRASWTSPSERLATSCVSIETGSRDDALRTTAHSLPREGARYDFPSDVNHLQVGSPSVGGRIRPRWGRAPSMKTRRGRGDFRGNPAWRFPGELHLEIERGQLSPDILERHLLRLTQHPVPAAGAMPVTQFLEKGAPVVFPKRSPCNGAWGRCSRSLAGRGLPVGHGLPSTSLRRSLFQWLSSPQASDPSPDTSHDRWRNIIHRITSPRVTGLGRRSVPRS